MDESNLKNEKRILNPEPLQPNLVSRESIDMGPLANRLGYILRRAQIAVFSDFFEAFASHKIKPAQYSVLTIIGCNPGLSQTQVAEVLGIKKPNFVAMIKTLETRDLAERVAIKGDKRSNALYLTQAGKALLKKLDALADVHEKRIRGHIGSADYDALHEPLTKIAEMSKRNGC